MCYNNLTSIHCSQTNCKDAHSFTFWPVCGLGRGGLSRRRQTTSPVSAWCCAFWAHVDCCCTGKSWAHHGCPVWTPRWCAAPGSIHVRKLTSCCAAAQVATVPPAPDGLLHASRARSLHSQVHPSRTQRCCSPDHSDHLRNGLYNTDHTVGWKIERHNRE